MAIVKTKTIILDAILMVGTAVPHMPMYGLVGIIIVQLVNALNLQLLKQQQQPRQLVQIYGWLQNAKRKIRPVNAILHALRMIAPRPRQTVKRNARFARPNMNHFTMLSSF